MAEQQDIDSIVKQAVQKKVIQYKLQLRKQMYQQRQAQKQAQRRRPRPTRRKPKHKRQTKQRPPSPPINPYVACLARALWQNVVVPGQEVSCFLTIRGDSNTCNILYNPMSGEFTTNYRGKEKRYLLFTKYEWDIQGLANDLFQFLMKVKEEDKSPINPPMPQYSKAPPFSISKAIGR